MAKGFTQTSKDIIDDSQKAVKTTYSSKKIEDLVANAKGTQDTVFMLGCYTTAPTSCNKDDVYYNTTSKLIFTATATNMWDSGTTPKYDILYVSDNDKKIYKMNAGNLEVYGGGGGSSVSSKVGNAIQEITGSSTPSENGIYVEDLSNKINALNIAQKTVNEDLEYFSATGTGNGISLPASPNYNFLPYLDTIKTNLDSSRYTTQYITLKAGKTYQLSFGTLKSTDNATGSSYHIVDSLGNQIGNRGYTGRGYGDSMVDVIYTPTSDIKINPMIVTNTTTSTSKYFPDCSFFMVKEVSRTITIDPVNYIDTTQGIQDTPVGTIINVMGNTTPKHYLACDGTVYNIVDYPYLSEYIKTEFGSYDHFGGDGISTFAVPSLGIAAGETVYSYASTGNRNDEDTWNATADCTVTYTLATGLGYNAVLYVDGVQVDMSNPNVPNVSTSGTITLNKGQTLKVECGDAVTTIKAVSLKTESDHCVKYEPTYFIGQINGNEYIEEILDKQSFNMATPGINQIGTTKQFTKSITNFDKIEFAYSLSKIVDTAKDYAGTNDGIPTNITYTSDNKGFVFNGSNSQIQLQDNAKTFPLTVEIILSATSYKHNALIYTDAPTGIGIGNWTSSKNDFLLSASTSNRYVIPTDFYNDTIRTLTVVYTTASNIEVYADGTLLTTTDGTDAWGLSGSGDSYIGRRARGNYFNGNIYGVRIYSRALSSSEVLQSYKDNMDYVVNDKPKVSRADVIQEYDFKLDIENNKPSFHTTRTIRVDDIDYKTSMILDVTKPSISNGIDSSVLFYNIKDKDNIEFEQTINRNSYSTSATTGFTQIHIDKVRGIRTINKIQSI